MKVKEQLLELCNRHVNKRIKDYKNEIDLIKESIESNDKVSNDPDDSGNSKLHEDLEKNLGYLNDAFKSKEALSLIRPNATNTTIVLGSIVITDSLNFFISTSVGKLDVNGDIYFAISLLSPIGQLLKSKTSGDSFNFNQTYYTIIKIL